MSWALLIVFWFFKKAWNHVMTLKQKLLSLTKQSCICCVLSAVRCTVLIPFIYSENTKRSISNTVKSQSRCNSHSHIHSSYICANSPPTVQMQFDGNTRYNAALQGFDWQHVSKWDFTYKSSRFYIIRCAFAAVCQWFVFVIQLIPSS